MKNLRKYNEMTVEEKKHSIHLWKLFYENQLQEDFQASWEYWKKRLEYLEFIGIDHEKTMVNRGA